MRDFIGDLSFLLFDIRIMHLGGCPRIRARSGAKPGFVGQTAIDGRE
jgi:uncharacterized protein YceK